jgi:hypothetical protein
MEKTSQGLSYSQIEENSKYKLDGKVIFITNKHIALITSATDPEFSGSEERIIYYFVDNKELLFSFALKDVNITY